MSSAKITLIGCANWFKNQDLDLFSELSLPTGISKDTLCDNILLRGGEFEVQYADPDFLKGAIGIWSRKQYSTIDRWVKALAIEYNPLENYDRMEDWTDNTEGTGASSSKSVSNRENSASNASSVSAGQENTKTVDRDKYNSPPTHETLRSAFDSSNYEPSTKEIDTGKWEDKDTLSSNSTQTDVSAEKDDYTVSDDNSSVLNSDSVHSGRIHGNIGTLTSQKMLTDELELGYWNIYEKVTELFLQEFTIPVYA